MGNEPAALAEVNRIVDYAGLLRRHVGGCLRCGAVALMYSREIEEAIRGATLPAPIGSRIRARICRTGAKLLDHVLGVSS